MHQMGGFDPAAAAAVFDLVGAQPLVVVAVGTTTRHAVLPEPLAARERAPRARTALAEILLHPADAVEDLPLSA